MFAGAPPVAAIYLEGAAAIWALGFLAMLGYLVVADRPNMDDALAFLFVGLFAGVVWPVAIAALPFVALVYGLRLMIHGPYPRLSCTSRREARIRRMEQRTAELEKELQL